MVPVRGGAENYRSDQRACNGFEEDIKSSVSNREKGSDVERQIRNRQV
jgi:hypothetical protein